MFTISIYISPKVESPALTDTVEISKLEPVSIGTSLNASEMQKLGQVIPSTPTASTETNELARFGLASSDRVLEFFTCALYPKKGILTQGRWVKLISIHCIVVIYIVDVDERMYITQHFLAFSGWPDTRVLLPLQDLKSVEKMNTLKYVPNAILIKINPSSPTFIPASGLSAIFAL